MQKVLRRTIQAEVEQIKSKVNVVKIDVSLNEESFSYCIVHLNRVLIVYFTKEKGIL